MVKIIILTNSAEQILFADNEKYQRNDQSLLNHPPGSLFPQHLSEKNSLVARAATPEKNVQLIAPGKLLPDVSTTLRPVRAAQKVLNAKFIPNDPTALKPKYAKVAEISPHTVNQVQEKTGQQWPMGIVPYLIDTEIYDASTTKRIVKAMSLVESHSCVLFKELLKKPVGTNESWLYFTNPTQERECVHDTSIGDAGAITVVLGFDCLHPDELLHTVLHAIGFNDEVSHPHRDQYIRILWDNIQPKYRHLYRIQYEDAPYKLVEYDPMSIMHFHDRAFSANGAATIASVVPGLQIGYAYSLSQLDVMKLKLAFGHECSKRKIGNLLDTCKNALSPQNIDVQGDLSDEDTYSKNSESDTEIHPPSSTQ